MLTPIQIALGLDQDGPRQLQWLAESALLAISFGQEDRAAQIYRGLQVLAPNEPIGWVGLAGLLLPDRAEDALGLVDVALRKSHCELEKMVWCYRVRAMACQALGDVTGRDAAEAAVLRLLPTGAASSSVREAQRQRLTGAMGGRGGSPS